MPRIKTERVDLRFSTEEKTRLKEKAAQARMNMNKYVLALSEDKKIIVAESLPNLVLEITRIGVNINQVAAVSNRNKSVNKFQIDSLNQSLHEVRKLLKAILKEVYGDS